MIDNNNHFMNCAIELAKKGEGLTSPNPPVGSILVEEEVFL